jgi:hypothetical protein
MMFGLAGAFFIRSVLDRASGRRTSGSPLSSEMKRMGALYPRLARGSFVLGLVMLCLTVGLELMSSP